MDNSRDYIFMCQKAHEIQNYKEYFNTGDFIYDSLDNTVKLISAINSSEGGIEYRTSFIYENDFIDYWILNKEIFDYLSWLPRIDQLQQMEKDFSPLIRFLYGLDFYNEDNYIEEVKYFEQFDTFEKCLLAFIMKENYNKIWDKGNWKLENEIYYNIL